jgi:hypothetical protein
MLAKGGGQEVQGPRQCQNKKSKKKKGKEKVHTVKENVSSSSGDSEVAFTNTEPIFLSKTSSGLTHIIDTGASTHMMLHKILLRDYKVFNTLRCISAANKGLFIALGASMLILPAHTKDKNNKITLNNTLYAPDIAFMLIYIW